MFGASALGTNTTFGAQPVQAAAPVNPNKDYEVSSPPDDTVSALKFSPASLAQNYLVAGSWDSSVSIFKRINSKDGILDLQLYYSQVRLWEVEQTGKTVPKSMKTMGGPVLDVCWADVSQNAT